MPENPDCKKLSYSKKSIHTDHRLINSENKDLWKKSSWYLYFIIHNVHNLHSLYEYPNWKKMYYFKKCIHTDHRLINSCAHESTQKIKIFKKIMISIFYHPQCTQLIFLSGESKLSTKCLTLKRVSTVPTNRSAQ